MGEHQVFGTISDRIDVTRAGTPVLRDAWRLSGDMTGQMAQAAVGAGATAMVTLTYIAADAKTHLARLRALAGRTGGASLLACDILVLRLLAASGYDLRKRLLPILDHLTQGHLPLCWRL